MNKMIIKFLFVLCCLYSINSFGATPTKQMAQWRPTLTREAQFIYGINAPVAMFAGQITQESGGRANITASDGGMGLTQFMSGTVTQVVRTFPELGPSNPYDPRWAIRAQVRYDGWIKKRVKGKDDCQQWGAALKGYNAGLGYVQQSQRKSIEPNIWFEKTEYVLNKQSAKNFEYSRWYPRVILFKHQKSYKEWGGVVCDIDNPPIDLHPLK